MLTAPYESAYNLKKGFIRGASKKCFHWSGEQRKDDQKRADVGVFRILPHPNQFQNIGVSQLTVDDYFSAYLLWLPSQLILRA